MHSRDSDGTYPYDILLDFTESVLQSAGLEQDRAHVVADILLEGDLMGHSTHGVQLLGPYLQELEAGRMVKGGDPEVINDRGSAL